MALPNGLLEAAQNYSDITWDDPDGNKKLSGIIERGMKYLNKVAGAELDYTVEDAPRAFIRLCSLCTGRSAGRVSDELSARTSYPANGGGEAR